MNELSQKFPFGSIAQLVERLLYTQDVTGSSPVVPTNKKAPPKRGFAFMMRFTGQISITNRVFTAAEQRKLSS